MKWNNELIEHLNNGGKAINLRTDTTIYVNVFDYRDIKYRIFSCKEDGLNVAFDFDYLDFTTDCWEILIEEK